MIHLELYVFSRQFLAFQKDASLLRAQELVLGDNTGINDVSTKPQVNVITAFG